MIDFTTKLESVFAQFNIPKNPHACSKLYDYLILLQKWNKVYNLTAIRDPQEMFVKHLLDSLAVAPHVDSQRLIDVGTGGGLPGAPLAILYPERQVDLLDSSSKKIHFLTQVKAELVLDNVSILHKRVEEYQPEIKYDGVISRAFSSLDKMLDLTSHLIDSGGSWWAMKSQKTQEELAVLPEYAEIKKIFNLDVPGLGAERTLIRLKKIKEHA